MIIKNSKIRSRLKTISFYSLSQVLGVFSVLLLSFIIIRFHTSELWGRYSEILIWSNFFILFLGFGSRDYLLKAFSQSPAVIYKNWINNTITRSLLLIPCFLILYLIPVFKDLEILIFILIGIQFLNQSFKVLILFHRDFKFNIYVEILYNLFLITYLFSINSIQIEKLIILISVMQSIKFICYILYYSKKFRNIKYQIQFNSIKESIPFFIPLVIGTIRVKIDAYYGTFFFDFNTLSKYQVFLSFLMLAQMGSSFVLNPFLKNFYRSKDLLIYKLKKQLFWLGFPFSLLITGGMYIIIEYIYKLQFTILHYAFAFIYMIPLFLHMLLVNEYYKKNLQSKIAIMAVFLTLFQAILGYYLIKNWNINGALILKTIGQWSIVIILWLWIKRKNIIS
ncbi:hypothetical protein [Aquimarina sp. 2201CG5-10]|uniref:hypothetical protein n=1 Tax=Aquimarina callyspongiae TaxID=3098150 RepID=UPI002AB36E1D|nr:hypothetical protein [Aquimarina sp. 2201CG5-10]MDY8138861.1 hypothetical protein [Aquimarina sp. 2201CG5-10]